MILGSQSPAISEIFAVKKGMRSMILKHPMRVAILTTHTKAEPISAMVADPWKQEKSISRMVVEEPHPSLCQTV
jgi:hypothetical protein